MTRFFFHVRDGDDVSRDTEGQELPSLDAACQEALNTNREMLAVLNSKDTLLQEGQLRSFKDDVTQSAPTAESSTSSNRPPR